MWPSHRHGSLASSLRVFILDYFRTSATEDGHRNAGHGQGMFLSQQQERMEMRAMQAADAPATSARFEPRSAAARSGPGPVG